MTDISGSGFTRSEPDDASDRWWSRSYAIRLAIALVVAGAIVGAVVGPASMLFAQVQVMLDGGRLGYPAGMYVQTAGVYAALGVLIASTASIAAVLLPARPRTTSRYLLRIMAGPILAGSLLVVFSLFWGLSAFLAGLPTVITATAFGCGAFLLAALSTCSVRGNTETREVSR